MTVENLANGGANGLGWSVDHDDVAGTIGVTVTGSARFPGTLMLQAQVINNSNGNVIVEWGPQEIDQFAGLGRQVLLTDSRLVGLTMIGPQKGRLGQASLNIWAPFQPA